mgnify:FL=1
MTKLRPISEIVTKSIEDERGEFQSSSTDIHAYASEAGQCARSIAMRMADIPVTDPPGDTAVWSMHVGSMIHDRIQRAIMADYPEAALEVPYRIGDITGRADATYEPDGKLVVCEIKSMAPYAFEKAVLGTKYNKAEGPSPEHAMQLGIGAVALKAAGRHLIYANKAPKANQPAMHEWRDKGSGERMVAAEIKRLGAIVNDVESGILPEREYGGDIIEEPQQTAWPCSYCRRRAACVKFGPGRIELGGATS